MLMTLSRGWAEAPGAMTEHRRVVRQQSETHGYTDPARRDTVVSEYVDQGPSGSTLLRRIVVFVFGVIQVLLILRIVGLLVDAQRTNDIVRVIYDVSAILVAPFEGIIRTEMVERGSSVLDVTAIVALVGWTILELVILAAIGIFRREPV
jgi:hypothetical protein